MSQIPVVQGVTVQGQPVQYGQPQQSGYGHHPPQYGQFGQAQQQHMHDHYGDNSTDVFGAPETNFNGIKGEPQPKEYKDVVFALAFIIHLVVMMIVMSLSTTSASSQNSNRSLHQGIIYCVSSCGLVACGLSTMALGFMMNFATELVKTALVFSVGCSLAVGVMCALSGQMLLCGIGFLSFGLGCCYAYFVWVSLSKLAVILLVRAR